MREDTTRIDFQKLNGKWFRVELKQNARGQWERLDGGQLQGAITDVFSTLETSNWIVRQWPGGARAFRGCLFPIRNPQQAEACRQILLQDKRIGSSFTVGIDPDQLDFRYDYIDYIEHGQTDIFREELNRLASKPGGKSGWERRLNAKTKRFQYRG